ncbi:L-type lectin-domain containing receptor kinase SIT2-like [Triticum urartu]|nr:L-type lectin-domain containing receptor kinase SIT2-like [Triticum urartu]
MFQRRLAAVILLLFSRDVAGVQEFVYDGFAAGKVVTTGTAVVTPSGILQLTNDTKETLGHGFHPAPLRFRDASTGAPVSFSTTFVLAIAPRYPDAHGHGIAFALAPSVNVSGAVAGKYLGLFNTSNSLGSGTSQIVAVELDTVMDMEFQDADDNHVGVDVNSLHSVNSATAGYWHDDGSGGRRFDNISLTGGSNAPVQVWIEYDGDSARLEVTLSPAGEPRPALPLLSCHVNLSSAVADDTYVGFSAANGAAMSSHYVLGWSFRLGGGRAPDLDLSKLPSPPSPRSPKRRMPHLLLLALLLLAVVVLLLVSAAIGVLVMRRRQQRWQFAEEDEEGWEMIDYSPHRISYKDLHDATNGFRDVIGVGGFGRVYHGVLPRSGVEVAVKKVSHGSQQGLQEFLSEITSMSRLRHRNLVQLLGYCRRRDELVLVYDYMPNGSLDQHLFGRAAPGLSWEQRAKIVRGVAGGLLYLHEGWEQVVVHRDIKAGNVLLDADMNGKLSDFGFARLYDHGGDPHATHVVGTLGYIAPEMSKTGMATTSSDVFAFGAFLLEVACGRRPVVFTADADGDLPSPAGIVELVLQRWKAGKITEARDPRIGECDEDDLELVLKLGLLCSHPDPERRPGMRQVVQMLEHAVPPPEMSPEVISESMKQFEHHEAFDEFVGMSFPSTSEVTTATTRQFSNGSRPRSDFHSS